MLSQTLQDAINEQVKNELYSSYLYLSMSAYFESIAMPGMARWMHLQYQEEVTHALKFFEYLHDRGARARLKAIDQPPSDFDSPLAVFQQAYEHEQKVTAMINNLYGMAQKENDYATQAMLQWFVNEQVEEEKNASQIVDQLKRAGQSDSALLFLDRQLGMRAAAS